MFLFRILGKDRCACKTEYLEVVEELDDVFVAISEMASVTFIKNHHNLLIAYLLQMFVVVVPCYSTIQFLDGGDNYLAVSAQTLDKLIGVVRIIHRTRFECLILGLRLRIEVVAVNNEHDLVYSVDFTYQLCSLE